MLINLADEKGLLLSVYHNRRWDGDFLTVKKLIEKNMLGDIKHFESHFDRFRPDVRQTWREQTCNGGGILYDLGSHLIDQAVCLFGIPDAVTAQCKVMREKATNIDYFHVVMHYPSHIAVVHSDVLTAMPNHRFCVKGTKGSYEKHGLDPQEKQLMARVAPNDARYGLETEGEFGQYYGESRVAKIATEQGCYQQYFRQLAQALRLRTALPVTASDAL